jgi:hypothetical protein
VLLTRSRLGPRPKPGSSLHLHVLGTPPAFVLSQDQTLREELRDGPAEANPLHKESSGRRPSRGCAKCAALKTGKNPGPVPVDQALAPHEEVAYTSEPRAQDGVNLICRQPTTSRLAGGVWRHRTWTHTISAGVAKMVRMLLSFQRPSHHFGEVFPLPACAPGPGKGHQTPSGLMSIAPPPGPGERPPGGRARRTTRGRNADRQTIPALWSVM